MICSAVWVDVVIVVVVMGILGGSSVACSRNIIVPSAAGEMETTYFASMPYAYMTYTSAWHDCCYDKAHLLA